MRPDQALQPRSRAGSGPAPQSQVFFGKLVIISSGGPSTGLFVYSGTPALGNPPVLAIVAPGVTHDPFGNPAAAVLNVGNVSAAHFGVNASGDVFIVNSSDTVIFHGRSSDGGFFWYTSAGEGAGNLKLSVAPVSGTVAGNTFQAGVQIHGPGVSLILSTGVTEELVAANLQTAVSGGVNEIITAFYRGPQSTPQNDFVQLVLNSGAKDSSVTAGGALEYTDTTPAVHNWLVWGVNGTKVFSALVGDTNTYQPERLTQDQITAATINSTSFTQILQTANPGVGKYVIKGHIDVTPNQAAGFIELEFSGSAVFSSFRVFFNEFVANTAGGGGQFGAQRMVTGTGVVYSGATFGAADRVVEISGEVTVSTAGNIGLFAACGTSATDTYVVHTSSFWEWFPIGP